MISFGERLKRARKRIGFTQKQAADAIAISDKSLSRYENDSSAPDPYTISALISLYDVSADYILGLTDEMGRVTRPFGGSVDIKTLLMTDAAMTEECLKKAFASGICGDTGLRRASEYSVLGGGKRVRAFLTLETCAAFGGEKKTALPFAAAIECIHAFSLVHDDMPCMDDDDMRRGKPSTHKAFGEAEALLCGDELFCMAFELAAGNECVPAQTTRRVVLELSRGSGALGMAGGQQYDLCELPESYDELIRLHRMKTGALIAAACVNGYYAACERPDKSTLSDIREYAYSIGLAFQIVDDILDVISDEATLGKPIGSDAAQGKITSLTFMTIDEARAESARLTERAKSAIAPYDGNGVLRSFADYLLARTF